MKKNGFTLSELIVTLSIVAIGSVMVAPLVSNIMPDKNKVKVVNFYKQIGLAVDEMFNDETIYKPVKYYDTTSKKVVNTIGLKAIGEFDTHLKNRLGIDSNGNGPENTHWEINRDQSGFFEIIIDLDKNKEGCVYSKTTCSSPKEVDKYCIIIDEYGGIRPSDNLTRAYLENPTVMNNIKADFKKAKNY